MSESTLISVAVVILVVAMFGNHITWLAFADPKLLSLGKVMLFLAVLTVMYYNLHLGILLLVAYIMVIIQLNTPYIVDLSSKKTETFKQSQEQEQELPSFPVVCENKKKAEMNNSILEYSLDPKVKPYEVFIKMMTSQEQLDKASSDAFLVRF
jgi:hypothetical protein